MNAAKTELLNEIDEITAAEVDACKDSALTDAENLARMTPTQLDNFATRAVDCVNKAVNFINALDSLRAVNQVSFAMNTVAPLALIARARLGLSSDFLRPNVRAANEAASGSGSASRTTPVSAPAPVDAARRAGRHTGPDPPTCVEP